MNDRFRGSRLKIERAKKHLSDFHEMFALFSNPNCYSVRVEENLEKKTHSLRFDIDMSGFDTIGDDATLIIGDVLHNLRSALDHLYYQLVRACGGAPTDWTRFPIDDTREEVERRIREALRKGQINSEVADILLNQVKPYRVGNPALWGLHKLNILDKHEKIVPTLKLMGFIGVRLENEDGEKVGLTDYIAEKSCLIPLTGTYRQKITLKDKGRPSANIFFNVGASGFEGEPVFPRLKGVAEEVTRTVDTFEHFFSLRGQATQP